MTISRRFLMLSLLTAALAIPLFILHLLVWDRQSTASGVREQISAGWGGEQSLTGPYLVVPFTEPTLQTVVENGRARELVGERRDALVIAPDDLRIAGRLDPQVRQRSLFEVIVYQGRIDVDARFAASALARSDIDPGALDWRRAYLTMAVGDARGFGGSIPRFRIGGRLIEAEPGSRDLNLSGAIHAPAGLTAAPTAPLRLSASLNLKGTTRFSVNGNARRMTIALASPWRHPSFIGLSADAQSVAADGFRARWSTNYLALNKPLVERASNATGIAALGAAVGGVRLIEPVDLYGQVSRAVKYGVLFIALTFLTFFTYDVTGRRRVPILAYALVGLGLVLFFLLLLALAEYISLMPAYILAAAALIGLISAYAKAVLGNVARAGVIGLVLTILYGLLYVLLQLEDFALLVGSLALFCALAVLMYVTRHVGESAGEEDAPAV